MGFTNDTKHTFGSGELSPKLRGRSDIEAYFSGVERMENFVPDVRGQARFRPGNRYQYVIDTEGVPDATVRDLNIDKDIRFATLNLNTNDLTDELADRLDSVLVSAYKRNITGSEIWFNIQSQLYGPGTVQPTLFTGAGYPLSRVNYLDWVQLEDYLFVIHPAYYGANKIFWDVPTGLWTCSPIGGTSADTISIINYPIFANVAEPKPTGVCLFEQRLVVLSSKPGVIHFGRSPDPVTGKARYLDMTGQTIIQDADGVAVAYRVPISKVDWQIVDATEFKVYLEDKATGLRTLKTLTRDYTYTDETTTFKITFGTAPLDTQRVVFLRNEGYADDGFTLRLQTIVPGEDLLWAVPIKNFLAVGSNSGVYSVTSSDGTGLSATNLKIEPISYTGSAVFKPIVYKDGFLYIDNTNRNFQYLRYDFFNGGYKSISLGPLQQNILASDISSITFSIGDPDQVFMTTKDYKTYAYTIGTESASVGFYRVITNAFDGVCEVYGYYDIRDQKYKTIFAYQTPNNIFIGEQDRPDFLLEKEDYYTGVQITDEDAYVGYLFDQLKSFSFLDLYQTFSDTDTLTMPAEFSGITVSVIADGVYLDEYVVPASPFEIVLDQVYGTAQVGFKYRGLIKTAALTGGGVNGEAGAKEKNIASVAFYFLNTLGAKFGFDLYDLQEILFTESSELRAAQPPSLFSGVEKLFSLDNWSFNKHLYIMQDRPFPCTIQRIDLFGETTNE